MRFTFLLFLVLATAVSLPTLAGGMADMQFAEQPIKQALAAPSELDAPLQLQNSPEISSAPAKKNPTDAPLDESADLWARIRAGFTMRDIDSSLVRSNIDWYANRPDYVRRMIDRSQLYLFHVVEEVEKRGMPTEIALLPMIESAFNPKAYSRSHASGIWQFIPSTGKNFGLEQNWWHDDRRDITAATDAALDYLQKLHNMFGSWELALAAYNWGEGSVQRAIAKNERRGLPTDYFSLKMPDETRSYLPKLMAVKQIVMNPAANNVELASIPNRPYFSSVITTQHIDLAVAARLAGMPLHEFVSLNPAYNRPVINAKGSRTLLLPVDKADTFASNLESYDKPLASWKSYTLSRGDRLDSVARRFSTSVTRLKEINGISKRYRLAVGQTLLVPLGAGGNDDAALVLNELQPPAIESGEPAQSALSRLVHGVKKGETLAGIAKRYKVSAAQIRALNNLKTSHLSRGMKLVIRQEEAPAKRTVLAAGKAKAGKPVAVARNHSRQHFYTVRRGDTVASIARRFNVAVNDIQRWNNFTAKHGLMPGSKVAVLLPGRG